MRSTKRSILGIAAALIAARAPTKTHWHQEAQPTRKVEGKREMTNGQKAYEAYSNYQDQKAHDGSPLPGWDGVPAENQAAWEAFGKAVSEGVGVDTAYNNVYLDAVKGKAMNGGPAPSFAFFVYNRPDIASAWAAAANAIH